jgi:hypothetical protein
MAGERSTTNSAVLQFWHRREQLSPVAHRLPALNSHPLKDRTTMPEILIRSLVGPGLKRLTGAHRGGLDPPTSVAENEEKSESNRTAMQ